LFLQDYSPGGTTTATIPVTIAVNNGIMLDRAEECTSLCVVAAIVAAMTHKLVHTSAPSISHAGTIQT